MTTHNAMHQMKTLCSSCSLRELCLPVGLLPNEFAQLDAVIRQSRRLKKGEYLFRTGEPFASLFAIRAGFFKTTVASQDGRDQVTGFFMSGELIGMDGICSHVHSCDAVALEDSEVCELPFTHIEELGHNIPSLRSCRQRFHPSDVARRNRQLFGAETGNRQPHTVQVPPRRLDFGRTQTHQNPRLASPQKNGVRLFARHLMDTETIFKQNPRSSEKISDDLLHKNQL